MAEEVDLTIVTMTFDASGEASSTEDLLGVLAKYVVLSRRQPGCRNIDICYSQTTPGRFLIVEKWETPAAQRDHFDSDTMVEMARASLPLVAAKPQIDLFAAASAQDLE